MYSSSRKQSFQRNLRNSNRSGRRSKTLNMVIGAVLLTGLFVIYTAILNDVPVCYGCNCVPLPAQSNPLPKKLLFGMAGLEFEEQFGFSVAGGRDLNCDDYADVAVGAPLHTPLDGYQYQGRVVVFLGSATGLSDAAGGYFQLTGPQKSRFGTSCAMGDVNGDGYNDLIVGAPTYRDENSIVLGCVYIFFGTSNGLNQTPVAIEGDQSLSQFGFTVAVIGDINNDGSEEFLVGAKSYINNDDPNNPLAAAGKVYLYSAKNGSIQQLWNYTGSVANANLGASLNSAGDVNGDGKTDIIIGAPKQSNDAGSIYVFYHTGDCYFYPQSPSWSAIGNNSVQFGYSVAGAGKIKGINDCDAIIVGAPYWDVNGNTDSGRAFIYYGAYGTGLGSNNRTADVIIDGQSADDNLGTSVGTIGDLDIDGYSEVFVGVPGNGIYDDGKVDIYRGSSTGVITPSTCSVYNDSNHYKCGTTAVSAGDINGDCALDIIIGGPFYRRGVVQVSYGMWETCCYYPYLI